MAAVVRLPPSFFIPTGTACVADSVRASNIIRAKGGEECRQLRDKKCKNPGPPRQSGTPSHNDNDVQIYDFFSNTPRP